MEPLPQDVRYGLRMLRNHPGFGAIVVLSLALGIGANAAIFTLIDAILLKSLPVKEPGRLVVLRETEGTYSGDAFEYPSYVRLRGAGRSPGCSLTRRCG